MLRTAAFGCLLLWVAFGAASSDGHVGEHSAAAPQAHKTVPACELHRAYWEELLVAFTATGEAAALSGAQAQERCLRERLAAAASGGSVLPDAADALLYLAAWTAQADHRFEDARGWLERFLARRPEAPAGVLMGAALALVAGDAPQVLGWCRRLRNVDLLLQLTCRAQALEAPTAAGYERQQSLIEPLIPSQGVRLQQWSLSVLGDLAARAGELAAAIDHYREVLSLGRSQRARLALADLWLAQGQPDKALAVLEGTDTGQPLAVQVKVLIAQKRLGIQPETLDEYAFIAATMQSLLERGEFSHGREMAEFYLHVEGHPRAALRAIEGALVQQREPEDLALWRKAKLAVAMLDHRAVLPGRGTALLPHARFGSAAYTHHEAE